MSKARVPLKVGDSCQYARTVTEADVVLFGGVTGDLSRMHFNEEFAKSSPYGTRVAHGTYTFSFASTASTIIQDMVKSPVPSASYGYDHIRFTAPVFFGDTITTTYTVSEVDEEACKSVADVVMTNQYGDVVCVCQHIMKYFPTED